MDASAQRQGDESTKKNNLGGSVVYNAFQDIADPFILRQLFFINTFSLIGALAAIFLGAINILENNYQVGMPDILTGVIFLLNLFFFRFTKNITVAKVIMLVNFSGLLLILLATGGTAHTGIYWFFLFPIVAFFLMGREKGILWSLCLACSIAAVACLSAFGYAPMAYSLIEIRQLFIGLFIVCILVYLYQKALDEIAAQVAQEKVKAEALLASIGEGMIAVDTTGEVLMLNRTGKELLRLNDRQVLGKSYKEIYSLQEMKGPLVPDTERPLYKAITKGDALKGDYLFTRVDGTSFPVTLVATPVIVNGKLMGAIELFSDITEQRHLDRTKSEFVALASHQLRTPISAISWFTEMLLNGDAGQLNKEQKEHLQQVYQSNGRMAELVTSLLYVSQLELGSLLIKPEPVDIVKISHTVLFDELSKHQGTKQLTITENYDPQLTKISLDPEITKTILQNLFINAIKYTPAKGSITVSILSSGQVIDESVYNEKEGILLKVNDTGYGIPKAETDKIFTKLFRGSNARQKEPDGTGLGLYIIQSILNEVGGKVWFESEENKGSTFFVWLPKEGMKAKEGKSLVPIKK